MKKLVSEREKLIGARLRAFREMLQITRTKFAVSIGCGGERIAAYEAGRARLPYRVFDAISKRYDLYPGWLNNGSGSAQVKNSYNDAEYIGKISRNALFTEIFDKYLDRQLQASNQPLTRQILQAIEGLEEINAALADESLPEAFRKEVASKLKAPLAAAQKHLESEIESREKANNILASILEKGDGKGFDTIPQNGNTSGVKSEIDRLVQRLNKVTKKPGSKAELARLLDVAPTRISEWLSGSREPGGNYTLQLLRWVEQQERQK